MTTTIIRLHAAASRIWLERMGVAVVVMLHSGCMRFRPLSNPGLLRVRRPVRQSRATPSPRRRGRPRRRCPWDSLLRAFFVEEKGCEGGDKPENTRHRQALSS